MSRTDGRHVLRHGEYVKKGRTKGKYEYKWREGGKLRSFTADTLEELREKEEKLQADMRDGIATDKAGATLDECFERWVETIIVRGSTLATYKFAYNGHISPVLGKRKVSEIDPAVVKKAYKGMLEQGVPIQSLEAYHTVLSLVLNFCVEQHIIRTNPASKALRQFKRQASKPDKQKSLTPDQQEALLAQASGTKWAPIVTVMLETGVRAGELCALTWDDVDLDNRILHVRRNLAEFYDDGETKTELHEGKTHAGLRDVPLSDEAVKAFEAQKDMLPCTQTLDGVCGFVFASAKGAIMRRAYIRYALARMVKASDGRLPDGFTPHMLRRTYATNAVRRGVSLPVLMRVMGHTSLHTTLEFYIEVQSDMLFDSLPEDVRRAINETVELA